MLKSARKLKTASLLSLVMVASAVLASTPAEIQKMIDQGDCDNALTRLQSEQSNHPNQASDILSALSISAGVCSGRINADNADYALKVLDQIEKQNPMLTGLNVDEFKELKARVLAFAPDDSDSSWTLLILVLLIIAGGYWAFFRGNKRLDQAIHQEKTKESTEFLQRKAVLSDAVNKLYLTVDDKRTKARIGGNEAQTARLTKFLANIEQLRLEIPAIDTLVNLVAGETRLQNISVLVKTV